jgi:heme exporter protein B
MQKIWTLFVKDMRLEARQKDMGFLMLAFAMMETLVFGFALDSGGRMQTDEVAGILWMGFLFAGMLGIVRLFGRETAEDVMVGMAMAPGGRLPVVMAKMAVAWVFCAATASIATSVDVAVFQVPGTRVSVIVVLVMLLGALGLASVGTLLSGLSLNLSGHEVLLPVLTMPFLVPVAIAGMEATGAAWRGGRPWPWIHALMAYDLIFMVLPLLLYEFLWEV